MAARTRADDAIAERAARAGKFVEAAKRRAERAAHEQAALSETAQERLSQRLESAADNRETQLFEKVRRAEMRTPLLAQSAQRFSFETSPRIAAALRSLHRDLCRFAV